MITIITIIIKTIFVIGENTNSEFLFYFFIPAQNRKVVKKGQIRPNGLTPNNKTFLFQVPGT